jgi:hypothetical protein
VEERKTSAQNWGSASRFTIFFTQYLEVIFKDIILVGGIRKDIQALKPVAT